jgi:hypothetical protein
LVEACSKLLPAIAKLLPLAWNPISTPSK